MIVRLSDMVPGHKMCCICFEYIPYDDLWVDQDGQKWDMCKMDASYDIICKSLRESGYTRDQIIQIFLDLTPWYDPDRIEP